MGLMESGLLTPEVDVRAIKARAIRAAMLARQKRDRALASVLWWSFGVLLTTGVEAVMWGLEFNGAFLLGAALVLMALWCGTTALLIVRSR